MKSSIFKQAFYLVLAFTAFSFAACSDDDDKGGSLSGTLPFENISGKYEVTNSSPYQSIELSAAGNYIITFTSAYSQYAAAPQKIGASAAKHTRLLNAGTKKTISRANEYPQTVYGTFVAKDENTLLLNGFGTLELTYEGNAITGFTLTPTGKSPVILTVDKEDEYKSDDLTNKLCRTWNVVSIHEIEYKYGKKVYDDVYTKDNLKGKNGNSEVAYDEEDFPAQILFSKAGTYLIYYLDNSVEYANWKWKEQSDMTIYYAWDNHWYDDEWCTLKFSGNKLTIIEDYEYDEDDGLYRDYIETVLQAAN